MQEEFILLWLSIKSVTCVRQEEEEKDYEEELKEEEEEVEEKSIKNRRLERPCVVQPCTFPISNFRTRAERGPS